MTKLPETTDSNVQPATLASDETSFDLPAEKRGLRKYVEDAGMRMAGNCGVLMRALCGSRAPGQLGILTYHRVATHPAGVTPPLHNVTPKSFRQQLTGLLQRGFTPWPLARVLEYRRKQRSIPDNTFVVTFDDGFASVYYSAFPVLEELQVPATIFLNTAYLDSEAPFPFDSWGCRYRGQVPARHYRPLSVDECLEMQAGDLVELGAHTHTHGDFRASAREFREDLRTNLAALGELFGARPYPFAFPFGSPKLGFAGGDLERVARQSGVTCALTTESVMVNPQEDPFRWGRMNVFAWDSAATLSAKLNGWYSWAPKLKQRIAAIMQPHTCLLGVQAIGSSTGMLEM